MARHATDGVIQPDAERNAQGDRPCVACGKATRGDRWVHLVGLGLDFASTDEPDEIEDAGDLGWFPIGPECAKKLPTIYVQKETS